MSNQLTEEELAALMPSELCAYQTPIPTQIVASDEFSIPIRRTKDKEKSKTGCWRWPTISGPGRAWTAGDFFRLPPAWPPPSSR
ncbi:MAG: uncharacterized protein QOD89_875 [Bradyrhizobium sp.]|nr:uncharacterized protein [Bradyrhizobium sp.]